MKCVSVFIFSLLVIGHDFSNVTTDPMSPGQIDLGQTVTVKFDYQTDHEGIVRISCYPESDSSFFQSQGSGSPPYASGTGSGSTTFHLTAGSGQIDNLLMRMFSDETSELIYEERFPVAFTYPLDPATFNPYPNCNGSRWVPHITKIGGDFNTVIAVENLSQSTQSYNLKPFKADGTSFDHVEGVISAGEVLYLEPSQVFSSESVSHFEIDESSTTLIRVLYEGPSKGSPVAVEESCNQGTLFHYVPSKWSEVFDGFAFVNIGNQPTSITMTQLDEMGQEIAKKTVVLNLARHAKALYLPEADFTFHSNSRFRIESDEPMVITALSGTRPESPVSYLWTNPLYKLK